MDGSKSKKKKCTQEETRDEGSHKKRLEGKKCPSRVFIKAWNTSRFAAVKDLSQRRRHATQRKRHATQWRRHATQWRSVARYSKGRASQQRVGLRCYGPEGVVVSPLQTKRLASRILPSTATKQASPRRTKKCDTVFLPSTIRIHQDIKNN